MYGIIIDVKVNPNREDEARKMLTDIIVPRARTHNGIVAGYWLRESDTDILRTIQIYDTKNNALETAERIRSQGPPPGAPVTLVSISIGEAIAQL